MPSRRHALCFQRGHLHRTARCCWKVKHEQRRADTGTQIGTTDRQTSHGAVPVGCRIVTPSGKIDGHRRAKECKRRCQLAPGGLQGMPSAGAAGAAATTATATGAAVAAGTLESRGARRMVGVVFSGEAPVPGDSIVGSWSPAEAAAALTAAHAATGQPGLSRPCLVMVLLARGRGRRQGESHSSARGLMHSARCTHFTMLRCSDAAFPVSIKFDRPVRIAEPCTSEGIREMVAERIWAH